jgi:hypothetical protein
VNPVEWHQFLTGLIREGAGAIATAIIAFITGVVACHWWMRPEHKKKLEEQKSRHEHQLELNDKLFGKVVQVQQDLEASKKAQRVAESERDEAQDVAEIRASRIASLEQTIEKATRQAEGRQVLIDRPPGDAPALLARLEAENRELVQAKQSLDKTVESLRTQLAQVQGELAHAAKWLKVFDEENARLTERRSLSED